MSKQMKNDSRNEMVRYKNEKRQAKKNEKAAERKAEFKKLSRAEQLFQGQLNPKKLKAFKPVKVEQWVEVRVKQGVVTVERYPDDAGVIKRGQKMWPPPTLVYRRINFPDGIPPAYEWSGILNEEHRRLGGCGIQRMTVETWLNIIKQEAAFSDGRILPVPFMPRPRENGECSCRSCQRAYEEMDRRAAKGVIDISAA